MQALLALVLLLASVKQVLPWKSAWSASPLMSLYPISQGSFLPGCYGNRRLLAPSKVRQACGSLQDFEPTISSVQVALSLDSCVSPSFLPFRPLLRCPFLESLPHHPLQMSPCYTPFASQHPGSPQSLLFLLFLRVANVPYYIPYFFRVLLVSPTQARVSYTICLFL